MEETYSINIEGVTLYMESDKVNDAAYKFRMLRAYSGMNRKEFSRWLHIPYDTMRDWESGENRIAEYMLELIAYKVFNEKKNGRI